MRRGQPNTRTRSQADEEAGNHRMSGRRRANRQPGNVWAPTGCLPRAVPVGKYLLDFGRRNGRSRVRQADTWGSCGSEVCRSPHDPHEAVDRQPPTAATGPQAGNRPAEWSWGKRPGLAPRSVLRDVCQLVAVLSPYLVQGGVPQLTDPLPRDAHDSPDLLQGHGRKPV